MKYITCQLPKLKLLIFLALVLPQLTRSQTYFQKVYYDSPYDQEGMDVVAMADGGYLIAGYTTNSTQNDQDIEVIKTDAMGALVWKKTYGGSKVDFAYHMLATSDGNYLIVGYSQSYGGGDFDVLLLKIDASGNTLWLKTYGGSGSDLGVDVAPTSDGNFILTGYSTTSSHGVYDMYLAKIDASGTLLWNKWIGGSLTEIGNSVKQTSDGGYIVLGMSFSYGTNGDAYLVKTDADGNTTWTKTFGGANYDEGVSITVNTDGSYAFLVRDSSGAGKDIDVRAIKTDASGNVIWNKSYGGSRKDTPKMIQPTMDGGYIVAAITRSFGLVNPDMWIVKMDGNGDTTWAHRYGGSNHEHCYAAREQSDGSYIAIGKTESYSPDVEVMFLKLSSVGTLTAGMEELFASRDIFRMYPNPAKDDVSLDLVLTEPSRISITDVTGKEIYSRCETGNSKLDIAMKEHDAGVYFVTVRSASRFSTKKLILK